MASRRAWAPQAVCVFSNPHCYGTSRDQASNNGQPAPQKIGLESLVRADRMATFAAMAVANTMRNGIAAPTSSSGKRRGVAATLAASGTHIRSMTSRKR